MRKIFLLLTFFFFTGLCFAQDQVQVKLSQPPPNQLRATDLWKAVLINTTKSTLHITLSGTLEVKGEGIVVDGKSGLISLPPGTKMITYNDVKTGNVNFKPGKWSEAFNRTGNAPSGDYTICIHVKAEDGREIGSSCIDQTVATIIPEEVSPHLTVKLIPPPPNQLKTTNLWRIVATNASALAYKAFLITVELKEKSTGLQVDSKLRSVVISGSKSFSFNDFNLADLTYRNTKLQEAYGKNMNAPDGNYTICVYVKNEKGEEIARDCIDQTITTIIPEQAGPQLTVNLMQPPPNQLRATDLWKAILINTTQSTLRITLSGTLEVKGEGIVVNGQSGLMSLPPGTKTITYDDVKSGNVNFKSGKWSEAFYRTGKAPSGDYTICIQAKAEDGRELGSSCIDQNIIIENAENISPQLISPADGSKQNSNMPILFTWMLPSVKPGDDFTYKIKVVEIINKQSPSEAVKQNPAWFEKSDIKTKMLQYPVSAKKIEKNKKYAWAVQLVNKAGESVGENGGMSESFMFDAEGQNSNKKSLTIPTPSDTTSSVGGTGTAAVGDTIKAGHNGEFKVIVTDVTTEADSSVTGKGRVHINWLGTNVAVEFKKIRVDTTKRLTSGGIVTTESGSSSTSYLAYPLAWAESVLTGPGAANVVDHIVNWTNDKIDNLVNWVNNLNYGQPQINYQSNIPPPVLPDYSLKMPFGLQFNNGNQKLVITEMVFKKDSSKINFLAQDKFTKSGIPYTLGFAGKYFPIHPSSINFSSGRIELVEDIKIPNTAANPKMIFKFIKGTPNSGCYVEWDSTGVKDISLALDVKFTRDWLLPVPTSTDTVKATIAGNGTSMQDILLTGTLDSCEIVGTNGIKIQTSPMSLDLSDSRNPLDMNFPSNYPNDSTVAWKGFYVKSFDVTLPDTWKTGTNLTAPVVSAYNFIIDDFGLTTKIKAVNVFNLQSGTIADLSASLDTLEISIISSSLVSGKAKGILVLPISEATVQNSLKYTATFNQVSSVNNFQIVILPVGPIDADILKGKLTLLPTSNITAAISPNLITLSINLNGTFNWDNPVPSIKGIKMEMGFENVGLTYTNNSTTNTLAFNPGTWSFASPPKWLANFPVSIKNIHYKSLPTVAPTDPNSKELLRGALMMDIVVNLTEDIGGTTTLGAAFAIERNITSKKFAPKFKSVFVDSIAVHADMPAVKIDGSISFRNEDPVFGNGFLGELSVAFTAVGIKAKALVEFGNTNYLYGSLYRYWRVEADVLLPPPGVPFLPGIAFRGFGGGAYYNMLATQATSAKTPSGKKFTFTPLKSTMGLRVAATIATTPKEETFNADVGLLAQFSKSQGLTYIAFTGDFWVGAGFAKRPKANISGTVNVSYDFPDKHFNLSASVMVNAPPITTPSPSNLVLDIRGKTNKWFFKFGEPVPNGLNQVDVFGVHLYEYLMFGNDIVAPSGFTQTFKDGYHGVFGTDPGIPVIPANTLTATGKGFALGIGFKFNKDVNFNLVGSYNASLKLAAGAELNLAFAEYLGNNCENPSERIGINGWQASGSIGFYATVLASVNKGSSTWNIADIKAGGWLQGKFPNPVYVAGAIQGSVKIGHFTTRIHSLGHWSGPIYNPVYTACTHYSDHYLVNTSFNKNFEYGTDCSGITSAGSGATVAQGDAAEDQKQLLVQYVHPVQQYSFPILSPLAVQFGLIPNNAFDVTEQQSDGSIKNRTFKMIVTTNLKIHNADGTQSNMTLKKNENNLGEYLYTVSTPITINTTTAKTVSPAKSLNTLNTFINSNSTVAKNTAGIGQSIFTSYPLPPATNTYNNLPPEPPEIKNNLTVNKDYTFTVTATLKEFISNNWVDAKNNNNQLIKQTVKKNFRTGPMVIVAATNNSKNTLKNK